MRMILLGAFALSLLMPVGARAEPDATFRYLMEEPATLLDLGMVRLEMFMDQVMEPEILSQLEVRGLGMIRIRLIAHYLWDENDFVIVASSSDFVRDWTRAECLLVMDEVHDLLLSPEVLFAELFSHRNFPLSRQPHQDIGRNMTKRLIVKTAFFKGANCEQRIGGPIRYTE